jgi:hypothetical protein
MAEPRVAKLAGTINWSDATDFSGYAVFGLVLPAKSGGGADWPYVSRGAQTPDPVRIPQWFVIPIEEGTFNQALGLFFNADIVPQNSQYVVYYYDKNLVSIASDVTPFSVTADPYTPVVPTLTAPVAGSTIPVPDS